jgi:hypothetical protein
VETDLAGDNRVGIALHGGSTGGAVAVTKLIQVRRKLPAIR